MDEMDENKSIQAILNVAEEDGDLTADLKRIANENNAVVLAFIAPYIPKRVNPVVQIEAQIGLSEEFGIDCALDKIRGKCDHTKLILVLNSPGGDIRSSYKVAKTLQNEFNDITVFIPHIAASGGTLIALAATRVVMGRISQLSLIDPQVKYDGDNWVSARSAGNAFGRLSKYFQVKHEYEAPYPYRALVDKLDPILIEEWEILKNTVADYAFDIMDRGGYSKKLRESAVGFLMNSPYTHDFVVDLEKAAELLGKKRVKSNKDYIDEWTVLKSWMNQYLLIEESRHFVRYVVPDEKPGRKKGEKDEKQGPSK